MPAALAAVRMAAAIGRREDTVLAEHVAPFGQPGARHRRNHLAADERDVGVGAVAELGRDFVRAHERRRDLDRDVPSAGARSRGAASAPIRSSARSPTSPRTSSCRSPASRRAVRAVARTSSSSLADRVAATVARMPAACRPRCRCRSRRQDGGGARRRRSPANTTCVCGSTKPGTTLPPSASIVRRVAGQLDGAPAVVFRPGIHDRAAERCNGAVRDPPGVGLRRTAARSGTGAGVDLRRVVDQEIGEHPVILRARLVDARGVGLISGIPR